MPNQKLTRANTAPPTLQTDSFLLIPLLFFFSFTLKLCNPLCFPGCPTSHRQHQQHHQKKRRIQVSSIRSICARWIICRLASPPYPFCPFRPMEWHWNRTTDNIWLEGPCLHDGNIRNGWLAGWLATCHSRWTQLELSLAFMKLSHGG